MTDHRLRVQDGTDPTEDDLVVQHIERFEYRVTAENGIFKNGTLYEPGSTILLDRNTARNFEALGEVEET